MISFILEMLMHSSGFCWPRRKFGTDLVYHYILSDLNLSLESISVLVSFTGY